MRYRIKPLEVEAYQLSSENMYDEGKKLFGDNFYLGRDDFYYLKTEDGNNRVYPGDYIIKTKNENNDDVYYIFDEEYFESTYEKIE
mgnify:CR=1 FL=1